METITVVTTIMETITAVIIIIKTIAVVTTIIKTIAVVTAIIETIFFLKTAQILLSSAALLKTKFEGVWMFLRKGDLRI